MKIMRIIKIISKDVKEKIAKDILLDLPEWFGIEDSRNEYIKQSRELDFYAIEYDGKYISFLSLQNTSKDCGEIYVIGTYKKYQNLGAGRLLIEAAVNHCLENGLSILQVKTLADTHPDENYKITRAFYRANDFKELEIFPELWDKNNPCLIMVKMI